jgi:hypothetical protein
MEEGIWCELVKLHTVHIKKPTKELVGRKRESGKKESEKHHPIAALGLRDSLGGGEDDGVVVGNETIRFGLLQLLLCESRGYPACRGIRRFPLASCSSPLNVSHTSTICAWGLCRRIAGCKDCNNGGGGGDKEVVNSTNPHFPLIYLPRRRNVG